MLTNLKYLLSEAERGNYAVPHFNFNNMEMLQALIAAAEKMKSPIILATSEGAIQYAGMNYLKAMAIEAAKSSIPVVFHLDHGKDLNIIRQAIDSGYTSIMFDGSSLPFEENIKTTWRIVQWAHTKDISVEAELGALRGVEDLVSVKEREAFFTDPKQAGEFVKRTGCDALAVAIGTSHGAFKFSARGGSAFGGKGAAKLDFNRLKEINNSVKAPLVLHGASGVPIWLLKQAKKSGLKLPGAKGVADRLIRKAINLGVRKINIDTDLRIAFTTAVRQVVKKEPKVFDPRKILGPAKDLMYKIAIEKIKLFKSANKA